MTSTTSTGLPAALRWAVWLLGVEAVIVAGVAGVAAVRTVAADSISVVDALAVVGFLAGLAAALAGLAVALFKRKPRARAPAIVLQLLAVMFAYVLLTGGSVALGLPLGLLGLVVGTLLLTPTVGAALAS